MSQPELHQHVIVYLPELGHVPAFVEESSDNRLTVVLSTKPDRPLRAKKVTVEYTSRRGVHRLTGNLHRTADSSEVLRLEPGESELIQRRDFVRVDAAMTVTIVVADPSTRELRTTSLNISGGGLLVADPHGIEPGAPLDLELTVGEGEPPVRAHGRIVRQTEKGDKGIQIDGIAEPDRDRLVRFVMERERQARRMTRDG